MEKPTLNFDPNNIGLTAEQVKTNLANFNKAIPVDTLNTPTTNINLPTKPGVDTTATGAAASGASTIAGNNANIANQPTETPATAPVEPPTWYQKVLNDLKPATPTSVTEQYKAAQTESGITEATAARNAEKLKLDTLNAELKGITDAGLAQKLALEGQGRGIPQSIIGGQQAKIDRETAIKSLPLQAKILAQQAMLTNSESTLQSAKDKLDTTFKLMSEDATRNDTYKMKLYDSAMAVATEEQKNALQAKKDALTANRTDITNAQKNAQDIAKLAWDSGDYNAAAAITGIAQPDPNSKTFAQDLIDYNKKVAEIQAKVKGINPDTQYKMLQIQKLQKELSDTGSNANASDLLAYAQDTVSTGKLPSVQELKNAGLSAGMVSQIAKELPKTTGEIVDNNTGIKSGKLSSAQIDSYGALKDLTNKLEEAKNKFAELNTGLVAGLGKTIVYTKAQQEYDILKNEIVDLLSRARSGAALTETEIKTYADKLPGRFNATFWLGGNGVTALEGLKNSIAGKLDTQLKAQGASMYGFSKVKVGGQDYIVGQEIEVNGQKGRINPDGTITKI